MFVGNLCIIFKKSFTAFVASNIFLWKLELVTINDATICCLQGEDKLVRGCTMWAFSCATPAFLTTVAYAGTQYNGKNNSNCPFCFLEKRIQRSLTTECAIDAPVKIHNRLQHFAKHFRNGRQEDAHELLRYAIEACNHVCVQLHKTLQGNKGAFKHSEGKGSKEEPHTVVKEIFGGLLQSQVKCLSCSKESNKVDEIMDLSLDIVRLTSLNEAFCRFFQPEVLDGDNKYRCDQYDHFYPEVDFSVPIQHSLASATGLPVSPKTYLGQLCRLDA